jgi:outer membrane receptor protein involved in Fe transport
MKRLFTLYMGLLLPLLSYSQTATLKGRISDAATKEGLPGVHVVADTLAGVTSNENGDYQISVSPGTYKFSFRFIGYDPHEISVTLTAGETKTLDVQLSEANQELQTVIVSAGRYEQKLEDVTVSVALIKPSLIENKNTTNAETIIDQVPGVTVCDGQVSIRGGSGFAYGAGSRVLMLVDDMPLLSADAGDVKWNTLPLENIEQIEVIKGAASVLYGSSALNGVIHIRTAYPRDVPLTKIGVTHGVYDNPARATLKWWDTNPYYSGINFFHSRKINRLDLVVGGAAFSDQGYRAGEDEHRGRINFNLRYRSKIHGLSYGLNGNYQYSRSGIYIMWQNADSAYWPRGGINPETNTESTISNNFGTRMNIDPYLVYYSKNGFRHSLRSRWYWVNNTNATNQSSDSHLFYGEYQLSKTYANDLNVTTGVAGYYSTIKSEFYGTHNGNNIALFGQADKKFGKLNVSGGVRMEYYRIDNSESVSNFKRIKDGDTITFPMQPVFRAGLNYHLFKETYLRASFGQGYRFPSIAEKYARTIVGALNIFPNPAVEAETGWSAEFGVKQGIKIREWRGYLDVAGFWTEYQNMMEFAFGVYNEEPIIVFTDYFKWIGFRAVNAENARITGIDASIVGKGKIFRKVDLTIFAGYTYMNPITLNDDPEYRKSFSDSTSNILKYRYKHLAKADLQFDYKNISFGVSARYNSHMVNIDRSFENLEIKYGSGSLSIGDYLLQGLPEYRAAHTKGALVFDARIGLRLNENARVSAVVNNVFNLEYMGRPGDVQAPRTFALQVMVQF